MGSDTAPAPVSSAPSRSHHRWARCGERDVESGVLRQSPRLWRGPVRGRITGRCRRCAVPPRSHPPGLAQQPTWVVSVL